MKDEYLREYATLLREIKRGIEREALRTDSNGELSMTPHPISFGSALTHASITTDYSEALLELITSPRENLDELFYQLESLHAYTIQSNPDSEVFWSHSMPMRLPKEDQVPIANFGNSNVGMIKHIYREGLALRYGRYMQCIAGLHYNFSLPTEWWSVVDVSEVDEQDKKNAGYLRLIRSFQIYHWVLMYLFGASPVCDRYFFEGKKHPLQVLDKETLYLPYATSIRMSDLGYKSQAQATLNPCYNSLDEFISTLSQAMTRSWPDYEKFGLKNEQGQWVQLNTHILQIENEYYSSIRPKQTARRGERPIEALSRRGIEYVEVRCLDIDYRHPLGIQESTAAFVEVFLLFCSLQQVDRCEVLCRQARENFDWVVQRGRDPNLMLWDHGVKKPLRQMGIDLLHQMKECAYLLDRAYETSIYSDSLELQLEKFDDPSKTPSAELLETLKTQQCSFSEYIYSLSKQHAQTLSNISLNKALLNKFQMQAKISLLKQTAIEESDSLSLDEFVARYNQVSL